MGPVGVHRSLLGGRFRESFSSGKPGAVVSCDRYGGPVGRTVKGGRGLSPVGLQLAAQDGARLLDRVAILRLGEQLEVAVQVGVEVERQVPMSHGQAPEMSLLKA
jgi:hypothetical protein